MRPTNGHTATYRGKWVRLVLIDGSAATGRFHERTPNGRIVLADGREFPKRIVARFIRLMNGSVPTST